MHISRKVVGAATGALLAVGLSGCTSLHLAPPVKSCGDYKADSKYGDFVVQQPGKGQPAKWSTNPKGHYPDLRYKVDVFADGKWYDGKDQKWAPHGSVDHWTTSKLSGKILQIKGGVFHGSTKAVDFDMKCSML